MSFWTKRIDKSSEFCWVAPSAQGERLGGGMIPYLAKAAIQWYLKGDKGTKKKL